MEGSVWLEMGLGVEGPDIDDGAVSVSHLAVHLAVCLAGDILGSPLTNSIQSIPFTFQILLIWLIDLIGLIEGSVSITGLVDIVVEETGGFGLLDYC